LLIRDIFYLNSYLNWHFCRHISLGQALDCVANESGQNLLEKPWWIFENSISFNKKILQENFPLFSLFSKSCKNLAFSITVNLFFYNFLLYALQANLAHFRHIFLASSFVLWFPQAGVKPGLAVRIEFWFETTWPLWLPK